MDPVAFTIGSWPVYWYGILIGSALLIAVFLAQHLAKSRGYDIDKLWTVMLITIPCAVIGARLYYVVFSEDRATYFANPLSILEIWEGGLAIYGGIIGGALAVLLMARIKKINFMAFADCTMPGIILAQAIGRWGNFCNGEAFGYETDIFCRMSLNNFLTGYETLMVHPCFFYESLWNIIGFVLINIFYSKRRYDGQVFVAVCGWYGLGRAWIEGLRTDSLYLPPIFGLDNLRISQVLAIGIFALCLGFLIYHAVKKTDKPLYVKANKKG